MNRWMVSLTAVACLSTPALAGGNTIADIVAQSGGAFDNNYDDFDLLLTALQTAELDDDLANESASFTVFAPNDAAFVRTARELGFAGVDEAGAWDFLVTTLTTLGGGDPIPVLTDILLYHVLDREVNALQFFLLSILQFQVPTLQGATFTPFFIFVQDNDPDLSDAFLIPGQINIGACNGIIHTVGRVLIPIDV